MSEEASNHDMPTNLIIVYLPPQITVDTLRGIFGSIGDVRSIRIVTDNQGDPRGFGFVDYWTHDQAKAAISKLDGILLMGKQIKVTWARPRSDLIVNANLHVSGLPLNWDEKDLNNAFAPFGTIICGKILKDALSGCSKGVGFVRYNKRSEAELARREMDRFVPRGSVKALFVDFAHKTNGSPQGMGRSQGEMASGPESYFPQCGPAPSYECAYPVYDPSWQSSGGWDWSY